MYSHKTKICPKCKVEKEIEDFYLNKRKNVRLSWCKKCTKKRAVDSRRGLYCSDDIEDRLKMTFYNLLISAKFQPRRKNKVDFSITTDTLKSLYDSQNGKCYYTGTPMKIKHPKDKQRDPFIISLDRVDSSKGYTPENVVLCCWGINSLKGANSPELMYDSLRRFYEDAKENGKLEIHP